MERELMNLLKNEGKKFSKGQKKIAEYIKNNYDKAAFMTAARLGKAVGVSESTVVRFAIELGFEGYPGFQKALSNLIKNKLTSVQRVEVASEQIGSDVLGRVISLDVDLIRKTAEEINRDAFNEAVGKITKAKRIYIIGVRSASAIASFIYFYFRLFFKNVTLVSTTSSAEVFETVMDINEDDVLIAISFPRYSKRTVKAAHYCHQNNASVIAITDSKNSPLSAYADDLLIARSGTVTFADSLVAPMSLANALIAAVGLQKKEEIRETFRRLEEIWDEYDIYEKSEPIDGKQDN